MTSKPYPEYKDSGVDWFDSVPVDWEIVRTRFLCDIETGEGDTVDAVEDGNYPFFVRSDTVQASDSFTFDGEAVLTAGDGAGVGKIFHRADGRFRAHQRVYVLTRFRAVSRDFFYYYFSTFLSKVVLDGSAKSTVDSIRRPMLADLWCTVPPSHEQIQIAEFLDRETAEIDAFILDQEELIALLTERRAATISHAVTRGLDPSAPMKDSGVEWLGCVPVAWGVVSGRRLFDQRKELAHAGDEQLAATQAYGVIPQSDYTERSGYRVVEVLKGFEILKRVRPGDFVISMRSFQGGLEYSEYFGMISSAYVMLAPSRPLNDAYFRYLFKCSAFVSALRSTSNLVRDGQAMRYSNFAQVQIPVPSLGDQALIADYLDREAFEIDGAIADAREAISLSKERRSVLISAAVTGKIDVRDHGGVE